MNTLQKLMQPGLAVIAKLTEELVVMQPSGHNAMMSLDTSRHEEEINAGGNVISVERIDFYLRVEEGVIDRGGRFAARDALWVVDMVEISPVGTSGSARKIRK